METVQVFKRICKKNNWRCTPQRLVIYEFMDHNLTHPSVDEVWDHAKKSIPAITRESVYRILNEFAAAGILYRMDKIESAHYDSRTVPHGHLVCEKCGKVEDFPLAALPALPEPISKMNVHHIEVRVSYVCPACQNK